MFEFEERKVRKIGYSHYLTLPPEWIKNREIEEGDTMKVIALDSGELKIVPAGDNGGGG